MLLRVSCGCFFSALFDFFSLDFLSAVLLCFRSAPLCIKLPDDIDDFDDWPAIDVGSLAQFFAAAAAAAVIVDATAVAEDADELP